MRGVVYMPGARATARTPDTICLLAALAVTGATTAVTGVAPIPISQLSTGTGARIWSIALALSSLLALLGVLYRDPLTGWRVELYGRAGLAMVSLGYVFALLDDADSLEVVAAMGLVGAIAIASIWQCIRILVVLRQLHVNVRGQ